MRRPGLRPLVAGGTDPQAGLQLDHRLEHHLHRLPHEIEVAAGTERVKQLGQGRLIKGHRGDYLLREPAKVTLRITPVAPYAVDPLPALKPHHPRGRQPWSSSEHSARGRRVKRRD